MVAAAGCLVRVWPAGGPSALKDTGAIAPITRTVARTCEWRRRSWGFIVRGPRFTAL